MSKYKVAILEDNKFLLKELKSTLEENKLAEVIAFSDNSDDFLEKYEAKKTEIDFVILDIELNGENIKGTDIALSIDKPILFASGETTKYLHQIENISLDSKHIVLNILKPITLDKLNKILPKIFKDIETTKSLSNRDYVTLTINKEKKIIDQNEIVFLETYEKDGSNKIIHLKDGSAPTLINFSFKNMLDYGFNTELFIQPHQSYRVNKNYLISYDPSESELTVKYSSEKIPVSENYRSKINNLFKKK